MMAAPLYTSGVITPRSYFAIGQRFSRGVLLLGMTLALRFPEGAQGAEAPDDILQYFAQEAQIVSASRIPEEHRKASATTYVISAEDLAAFGVQNLWDALRTLPGVDVMQTRTQQGEVSIRGLNQPLNSRTLVLLDGRSVLNGFTSNVNWESIPVNVSEIDRIEVVEGPASAVYGANAVNGVINIITKKPEQLHGGSVSYSAGAPANQLTDFVYGRRSGDIGYRVGGSWRTFNQLESPDQFAAQSGKFDTSLTYRISDAQDVALSGGITAINSQLTIGPSGSGFERGGRGFTRLDYRYANTHFRSYWNRGRTQFNEFPSPPNPETNYDTIDNELDHNFVLGTHRLVAGANYRRNMATSATYLSGEVRQDLWALYLEDKWDLGPEWSWTNSSRLDRHPFTGLTFSPRSSLIFSPVEEHTFRLSAGSAFRNPTMTENSLDIRLVSPNPDTNSPLTSIATHALGNRALRPERLESVELAHHGDFQRVRTNANLFYYHLHNAIQSGVVQNAIAQPPQLAMETSYENQTGVLKATGGELGADVLLSQRLTLFANYSYQYLRDDSVDQLLPKQSPRHKVNLGLRGHYRGLKGNLWADWADRTSWISAVSTTNRLPVDAYWILNAHLSYEFAGCWRGWEVGATAWNFLDHAHYEILPAQSAAVPGQNGELLRARWLGTISYHF